MSKFTRDYVDRNPYVAADEIERLQKLNADMLALLKDMRNAPDPFDGVGGWWEEIDSAIAKATEGQS